MRITREFDKKASELIDNKNKFIMRFLSFDGSMIEREITPVDKTSTENTIFSNKIRIYMPKKGYKIKDLLDIDKSKMRLISNNELNSLTSKQGMAKHTVSVLLQNGYKIVKVV